MSDYLTNNRSDLLQASNCVKTNRDTAPIPIRSPRSFRWQKPSSTEHLLTTFEDDEGVFLSGETSSEFCYKKLRNSATQTPPLECLFEENSDRLNRRSLGSIEVDYRRAGGRISSSRDIEFEKFLSNQQGDCYDDTKSNREEYRKRSESQRTWSMYNEDSQLTSLDLRHSQSTNQIKFVPKYRHFDEFEHSETMGTLGMSSKRFESFSGSAPLSGSHLNQRRFSNSGNNMKLIPEQSVRSFDEFEHSESTGTWGMSSDGVEPFPEMASGTHLNQTRFSNPGNEMKLIPEQTFRTYDEFIKSKSGKNRDVLPKDDSFLSSPLTQRRYSNPYSQRQIPERGDRSFDEFLDQRRATNWKEMGKELRYIADDLKLSPLNSKKSESLWRLVYRSFIGNSLEPNRRRSQSSGSLPRRK